MQQTTEECIQELIPQTDRATRYVGRNLAKKCIYRTRSCATNPISICCGFAEHICKVCRLVCSLFPVSLLRW